MEIETLKSRLSSEAQNGLEYAFKILKEEMIHFKRIRTKSFIPGTDGNFYPIDIRDIYDEVVRGFQFKAPEENRSKKDDEYIDYLNHIAMKIMNLKIKDLSPDLYLLSEYDGEYQIKISIKDRNKELVTHLLKYNDGIFTMNE